jgi:hypothetical protein
MRRYSFLSQKIRQVFHEFILVEGDSERHVFIKGAGESVARLETLQDSENVLASYIVQNIHRLRDSENLGHCLNDGQVQNTLDDDILEFPFYIAETLAFATCFHRRV